MNRHGKDCRQIEADRVIEIEKCTLLIHILITIISIHAHHIENICLHTNALACILNCRIKHPKFIFAKDRRVQLRDETEKPNVFYYFIWYQCEVFKTTAHTTLHRVHCAADTFPIQTQITHLLNLSATKFALFFYLSCVFYFRFAPVIIDDSPNKTVTLVLEISFHRK